MELVEYYRLRWWLVWWSAGLLLVAIPFALLVAHTNVDVNGTQVGLGSGHDAFPLSSLMVIPMFMAMVFGSGAGLSLNRESETRALSWTKPSTRTAIALRLIVVDVALVFALYVIALLVVAGVLAFGHIRTDVDSLVAPLIALSFGVAVMWYGLVQMLTAGFGRGMRGALGALWPVALFLAALSGDFGPTLTTVIRVVNVFNPLAYLSSGSSNGTSAFWTIPLGERTVAVWFLALIFCTVATTVWQRREA